MDPIESKRQELEAAAARRRAVGDGSKDSEMPADSTPPASAPAPEELVPLPMQREEPTAEIDRERATLELERERLALEREKLALERERLALEEAQGKTADPTPESAPPATPAAPGKKSTSQVGKVKPKTRSVSARHKAAQRSKGSSLPLIAGGGAVLGFLSILGLLVAFGDPDKFPLLSKSTPVEEITDIQVLQEKAEDGDAKAMYHLGVFFLEGSGGAPQDLEKAKRWLRGAVEDGDGDTSAKALRILERIREVEELKAAQEARRLRLARQQEEEARLATEKEKRARDNLAEKVRALVSRGHDGTVSGYVSYREELLRLSSSEYATAAVVKFANESLRLGLDGVFKEAERRARQVLASNPNRALSIVRRAKDCGETLPESLSALEAEIQGRIDAERRKAGEERARREREKREVREAGLSKRRAIAESAKQGKVPSPRLHIEAGLNWLIRHSVNGGYWKSAFEGSSCEPSGSCVRRHGYYCTGDKRYDIGVTSLAALAIVRNWESVKDNEAFRAALNVTLAYLRQKQARDGSFLGSSGARYRSHGDGEEIYNHVLATTLLAECLQIVPDNSDLRSMTERAVAYCLGAQNPESGWQYGVRSGKSDTSVTTWMLHALLSARKAGLEVPDSGLRGGLTWLDSVKSSDGKVGYSKAGGGSSYLTANDGKYDAVPTLAAAASSVWLLAGRRRTAGPSLRLLGKNLPKWADVGSRKVNFYYWYHGSKAMSDWGSGRGAWKRQLFASLLPRQNVGGCEDGSWPPVGEWCLAGGSVYATAMCVLSLTALADGSSPAPSAAAPDSAAEDLELVSHFGGLAGPKYVVKCKIRNKGKSSTPKGRVVVDLFLSNGSLVETIDAMKPKEHKPGAIVSYKAEFSEKGAEVIDRFKVRVLSE